MNFYDETGTMAIGSRLRMLTDLITSDAALVYKEYDIDMKPKRFPVLFVLAGDERKTITGIAKDIRQTHPSVSNIVHEMSAAGLIASMPGTDKRSNILSLSDKGRLVAEQVLELCRDMDAAVKGITAESHYDLWQAIAEWEELLEKNSLLQRVRNARRQRERKDIAIIPYEDKHHSVFKALSEQWISEHWQLEAHDTEVLEHPHEAIMDKGGHIFVATYKGEPVGVCALCRMPDDPDYDYEFSKLAVSPQVRGKGIGLMLGQAVVEKAKELGCRTLYLESNTVLEPAIRLYEKLGFKRVFGHKASYGRCNIQMVLPLAGKQRE